MPITNEASIIWAIPNFLNQGEKPGDYLISQMFHSKSPSKARWELHIYPHGIYESKSEKFVGAYVTLVSSSNRASIRGKFQLCIKDDLGNPYNELSAKRPYPFRIGMPIGHRRFIARRDLISGLERKLLFDGTLTFACKVTYVTRSHRKAVATRRSLSSSSCPLQKSKFQAVLENRLDQLLPGVLNADPIELWELAERFEIEDLKNYALERIKKDLDDVNCLRFLIWSDVQNLTSLKEYILGFLVGSVHRLESLSSEELKSLTSNSLASEIFFLIKDIKQSNKYGKI